jgi:hypothetical protein
MAKNDLEILWKVNYFSVFILIVAMCTPYLYWGGAEILYGLFAVGWFSSAALIILGQKKFKAVYLQILVVLWIFWMLFLRLINFSSASSFIYAQNIMFWLTFLVSSFYFLYAEDKYKKKICFTSIVVILINIFQNIIILIQYPNASRQITQASINYELFRSLNIGSTTFTFAGLLLFFIMIGIMFSSSKKTHKIVFSLVIIALIVYQVQASRAISLTLMVLGILLFFLLKLINFKNQFIKMFFILNFIIAFMLITPFMDDALLIISQYVDNPYLTERLISLSYSMNNHDIVEGSNFESRLSLYNVSINTFIQNPFIGVGSHDSNVSSNLIGYHSEFFDLLASYGVIGGIFWITFFISYYRLLKNKFKYSNLKPIIPVIFIVFIMYSLLNRVVSHEAPAIIMFLVLPYLDLLIKGDFLTVFKFKEKDN